MSHPTRDPGGSDIMHCQGHDGARVLVEVAEVAMVEQVEPHAERCVVTLRSGVRVAVNGSYDHVLSALRKHPDPCIRTCCTTNLHGGESPNQCALWAKHPGSCECQSGWHELRWVVRQ